MDLFIPDIIYDPYLHAILQMNVQNFLKSHKIQNNPAQFELLELCLRDSGLRNFKIHV